MRSLEERHAERQKHREEGPGPVVIEKDPEAPAAAPDEDEREPMRNKRPGSSKEQPGAEARVEGDDSIDSGFTFGLTSSDTTEPVARSGATEGESGTRKSTAKKTEGAGNGGGSAWTPKP